MHLDEPVWWYRGDAGGLSRMLAPFGSLYGWAAATRYARTRPYRSRLPVICVGNLTAGGTGKTPLVLHLCAHLQARGRHPVALTRGYGGHRTGPHWVDGGDTAEDVGDEALLLARSTPTLVARNRRAGAQTAEAMTGPARILVMDDGLQNPSLVKDLSIVMIDAGRGIGNGLVMPAGPLRAPLDFQLALAGAIVVNKAAPEAGDRVAEWLRHRFKGPVLRCTTVATGDADRLRGQRVVAWAGIGAPHRFFGMLEALGAELAERVAFRDHQRLGEADAGRLLDLARRHGARLLTTEKDLVRLTGATGLCAELAKTAEAVPIRLSFAEPDGERLAVMIDDAVRGA